MSVRFLWTCPYCSRDTIITDESYHEDYTDLDITNADGRRRLSIAFIVCPNPECEKFSLEVSLHPQVWATNRWKIGDSLRNWQLIPESKARAFPDCIPKAILDDYNEACLICDLSPKASATLSRRCLQGILRDFWKVKPGNLVKEIEQIEDKVDPETWEAIDAVRKVGNIGAHMEKDINLILDVEPREAELLVGLIETLLKDWYVAREAREARLKDIKKIAKKKEEKKKATSAKS